MLTDEVINIGSRKIILKMTGSSIGNLRRIRIVATKLIHRFVELAARLFFGTIYYGSKQKVPPISNMLLLESASSLAFKIRTQKVILLSRPIPVPFSELCMGLFVLTQTYFTTF